MPVQKVNNAIGHQNGRAVTWVPDIGGVYGAGYSGTPSITNITLSGQFGGQLMDDDLDFAITQVIKSARFTIGTAATGLNNVVNPQFTIHGVNLKAATTNGGVIYVGSGLNVTPGTTAATDGYPLAAGQELYVPVDDLTTIYAVASATGSLLHTFLV